MTSRKRNDGKLPGPSEFIAGMLLEHEDNSGFARGNAGFSIAATTPHGSVQLNIATGKSMYENRSGSAKGNDEHKEDEDFEMPIMAASIFLSCVMFYILVSQVSYCFLKRHDRKGNKKTFNVLCGVTSLVTFCCVSIPHLEDGILCDILHDFDAVLYSTAYLTIWTTLWLRQYFFYQSPFLKHMHSLYLRIISFGLEFVIVGCFFANVIGYFVTKKHIAGHCDHGVFEEETHAWIIIFVAHVVLELFLFCLICYPLYRHQKNMAKSASEISKSRGSIKLDQIIFRAAVGSAVCVLVTILTLPLRFILDHSLMTFHFVYNLNIVVKMISVISSFKQWKRRLFPWQMCLRVSSNEINAHSICETEDRHVNVSNMSNSMQANENISVGGNSLIVK